MSQDNERYTTQFNEIEDTGDISVQQPEEPEYASDPELAPEPEYASGHEDDQLTARIEARMKRSRKARNRRKRRTVFLMIIIFAALLTMCGREIVRLKAENLSLRHQHAQLEEERDKLKKELENVGNKEYVKDQARKQLRLLDPGEILFIFDEGQAEAEAKAEAEAEAEKKAQEESEESSEEDNEGE